MEQDKWGMFYHYYSDSTCTYLCYEGTLQDVTVQLITLMKAGFYIDYIRYMGDEYFS